MDTTTTNLADFGSRERRMLIELLTAWQNQGLPEDFSDEAVVPMMNQNSGNVFLTNEDCQVALMNGRKLESFYSCPYCGHEGFKDEMDHEPENSECTRYLESIGVETEVEDEEEVEV